MNHREIRLAVVALGPYGQSFLEVYLKHPNASAVSIGDEDC